MTRRERHARILAAGLLMACTPVVPAGTSAPAPAPAVAPIEIETVDSESDDQSLCEHANALARAELGHPSDPEQHARALTACIYELAEDRESLGPVDFEKYAMCLRAASAFDALIECELQTRETRTLRAACNQAVYLRNHPKPRSIVLAVQANQANRTTEFDECIGELDRLEPAERERMTTCMLDASDGDELSRC